METSENQLYEYRAVMQVCRNCWYFDGEYDDIFGTNGGLPFGECKHPEYSWRAFNKVSIIDDCELWEIKE